MEVTSALDAAEIGNRRRMDGDSTLAMLAESVTWRNVKFRRGMSPDCANYNRFRGVVLRVAVASRLSSGS